MYRADKADGEAKKKGLRLPAKVGDRAGEDARVEAAGNFFRQGPGGVDQQPEGHAQLYDQRQDQVREHYQAPGGERAESRPRARHHRASAVRQPTAARVYHAQQQRPLPQARAAPTVYDLTADAPLLDGNQLSPQQRARAGGAHSSYDGHSGGQPRGEAAHSDDECGLEGHDEQRGLQRKACVRHVQRPPPPGCRGRDTYGDSEVVPQQLVSRYDAPARRAVLGEGTAHGRAERIFGERKFWWWEHRSTAQD